MSSTTLPTLGACGFTIATVGVGASGSVGVVVVVGVGVVVVVVVVVSLLLIWPLPFSSLCGALEVVPSAPLSP